VKVVQNDDGRHRTGSDVRALVGEVVEILAKFSAGLTVHFEHRHQLRRTTLLHVIRPVAAY